MTTYRYTAEFSDDEHITLRAALAMLKTDCLEHMETTPGAPQKAVLRNIAAIEKKLDAGAQKTSGNSWS